MIRQVLIWFLICIAAGVILAHFFPSNSWGSIPSDTTPFKLYCYDTDSGDRAALVSVPWAITGVQFEDMRRRVLGQCAANIMLISIREGDET